MKNKKKSKKKKSQNSGNARKYINKNSVIITLIAFLVLISILFFFFKSDFSNSIFNKNSFEVNTILLKLNIPSGGSSIENIKITNKGKTQDFEISFEHMDSFATADFNKFSLLPYEEQIVQISFSDPTHQPKVYVGNLVIKTSDSIKKIPVILGVDDKNAVFAITQKPLPNYLEIHPGEKIGMDIKFFNLMSNGLANVGVEYMVDNFDGETIVSEQENIIIEGSLSTIKLIDIPKNIKSGKYVFITSLNYETTKSSSTYFFEIKDKGFDVNLSKFGDYLIIIILVIIMFILIFLFNLVRHKEEVSYLKKQQANELSNNLKLISQYKYELQNERQKVLREHEKKIKKALEEKQKIKEIEEKEEREKYERMRQEELEKLRKDKNKELKELREKLGQFEKEKKEVVRNIREKQERQREEIRDLKRQGKVSEIPKRIEKWGKEGREMKEIQKNIKSIPKERIKKILQKEKKETEKEFMDKYYSNLGKKTFKVK